MHEWDDATWKGRSHKLLDLDLTLSLHVLPHTRTNLHPPNELPIGCLQLHPFTLSFDTSEQPHQNRQVDTSRILPIAPLILPRATRPHFLRIAVGTAEENRVPNAIQPSWKPLLNRLLCSPPALSTTSQLHCTNPVAPSARRSHAVAVANPPSARPAIQPLHVPAPYHPLAASFYGALRGLARAPSASYSATPMVLSTSPRAPSCVHTSCMRPSGA